MSNSSKNTKPSQLDRILTTLRSGKSMTQAQARARGIKSLSSRVNELRNQGVPISSVPYRNREGRTVVQYRLGA